MRNPPELCDDGLIDSEGCNINCSGVLSTWICLGGNSTYPDSCNPKIGDGQIVGSEKCDDLNS